MLGATRSGGGRTVGVAAFFCGLLLGVPGPGAAADSGWSTAEQVRLESQRDGYAVVRALEGALHRLESDRCQAVLSDFRDPSGVRLEQVLEARKQTAQDRLRDLLFYDRGRRAHCGPLSPLAATAPGSRVIFVCGEEFRRAAERDRARAEAVIIHEFLHSLGLGENPPTSYEITKTVLARCAR